MLNIIRKINRKKFRANAKAALLCLVVLIVLYLGVFQADRYQSIAKVIVNQSQPLNPTSNSFGTLVNGQHAKGEDAQLIMEYIKSVEMMEYLDYAIDLRKIYSSNKADALSALPKNADKDELYKFYLKHIKVSSSADTAMITIEVQTFDSQSSARILEIIIRRSEEFINKIFHDVAKQQLDFIRPEVLAKEKRILELEKKLRQSERTARSTDSKIVNSSMERKLEFAIQEHKASLSALEKVRGESAQNLKKLVVITGPTLEIDASYPKRGYNIALFLCVFGLIYYILRSTYATIVSHREMK